MLESMLASVVLAISVFAITLPFTAGVKNEEAQQRQTVAVALAEELMEEILSKPFRDPQGNSRPGPEKGESSRALFDNADDYDRLDEQAGTIADYGGEVISDPAARGLSRRVRTKYVYVSGQQTDKAPTFLRVRVEVRYEKTRLVRLARLMYSQE